MLQNKSAILQYQQRYKQAYAIKNARHTKYRSGISQYLNFAPI